MTKKKCPLGEDCDLTIAWMAGRQHAIDRYREETNPIIEAKDAEIERLAKDKRWIIDERDRTFALMLSRAEKAEAEIERLRGDLAKAVDAGKTMDDGCDCGRCSKARATLAELTGGKDE